MKVVPITQSDDIVSICDRLAWANARQVLLVLPDEGKVLTAGLDLIRLRRFADRQRIEVGIVTPDRVLLNEARSLGVPAFHTERAARSRKGWWRGRRQTQLVGLNNRLRELAERPSLSPGDRLEMFRRTTPLTPVRRWLVRYAAILLFCITLALLYVLFVVSVPGATIILKPDIVSLEIEQLVVADPAAASIDYGEYVLPGRILSVTESWTADVETTGTVERPSSPAKGPVLFVNLIEQEVEIPVGTRVSTTDGENRIFQTVETVTLADVIGSTAEVDVVALQPGPAGNVSEGQINRVEGALATQVEVRNLEALAGGDVRVEAAVSAADMARLRAQVLQFLHAVAISEMESSLSEREFLTRDSVRVVRIFSETYSHSEGEQAPRLTLEIRAELNGTAVNTTAASSLAYEKLIAGVPEGHTLVPDSIRFSSGNVVGSDDAGRVSFYMLASATAAVELPVALYVETISGQEAETAVQFLSTQLPLRAAPEITVWPLWFDRVPYTTSRIQTVLDTGS